MHKPRPKDFGAIDEGGLPDQHDWKFESDEQAEAYIDACHKHDAMAEEHVEAVRKGEL